MTVPYHKINSIFKRDPDTNYKSFTSEFADPAFEALFDARWMATEKVDGTNIRLSIEEMLDAWVVNVQGRTDKAQLPHDLVENCVNLFSHARVDPTLIEGLTFYGEGYGAGIQKGGGDYRPDKSFVLFDILTSNGRWLEREEVVEWALTLDIPVVPLLGVETLRWWFKQAPQGLYANSQLHVGAHNEGYVLRPMRELTSQYGRVITKLKFKDFA